MHKIFTMGKNLRGWVRGLLAAFIAGGAGSAGTAITINTIDPKDFNFGTSIGPMMKLLLFAFIIHGLIGVFMFLAKSPLPDPDNGNGGK